MNTGDAWVICIAIVSVVALIMFFVTRFTKDR
jgi:hypothetical protein